MNTLHESPGSGIADHMFSGKGWFIPENPVSMFNILAQGNHLDILKPIVCLDAVLMVDRHLRRDSDKSLSHQSMGIARVFLGSYAKNDLLIAIGGINVAPEHSRSLALITNDSGNAPERTDLIEREIFNGFPLFHTCNHTMEYM